MPVTVGRNWDYDDEVIADGHKHKVVARGGQILVLEKGRGVVQYGDYGSTRSSREDALNHFRNLEAPYYQDRA